MLLEGLGLFADTGPSHEDATGRTNALVAWGRSSNMRLLRSVRAKLLGSFAFMLLVLVLIGVVSINGQQSVNGNTDRIYNKVTLPLEALGKARAAILQAQLALFNAQISTDPGSTNTFLTSSRAGLNTAGDALAAYVAFGVGTGDERDALTAALMEYRTRLEIDVIPEVQKHDLGTFLINRSSVITPLFEAITAKVDDASTKLELSGKAEKAQATSTTNSARTVSLALLGVGALAAVILGLGLSRRMSRRLGAMAGAARSMASGDLTVQLDGKGADEFAQTSRALQEALNNMRSTLGSIADSSVHLASSSEELSSVTSQMASGAEEASFKASSISEAVDQVARSVTTVASGAEEMTAAIGEIANSTHHAAQVATEAVLLAEASIQSVTRLGRSSEEIGGVVAAITAIAEQTNLLALNATIESARAGEAGRGFAVVAGEVKELANETAKATKDISSKIKAIQSDTAAAVDSIGQIGRIIEEINQIQTSVAASVEQQAMTTAEMTRNAQEAATGTSDINRSMVSIASAVQDASTGALSTRHAVADLAHMATALDALVG
ncbi:MAG: mcp13, partial [Acidimicrobiia bacterium]|nr:mcp13 [Acidimicrobiia bacterium]